ncbi:MAG: pimeloyl-ACP methyl ester carboxylesterase [Planctomycetota bacterium]|jgi:pimeloyl-ACP methyl ester carboxylesterase
MRTVRRATVTIQLLLVCLTACTIKPAPSYPRPALLRTPPPVAMPELLELAHHDNGRSKGILIGEGEQVRFEIRRDPNRPEASSVNGEARPMVLLVPILAGGRELMGLVAQRLAAYGFDVAFCERAGRALSPPQRGPELDELFRRTVLHQRLLLKWLRHADQPPSSLHVLGISMGGIISTVLAAIDHDLRSAAICLAGADLANLVLVSSESKVQEWLAWRQETDGIGLDNLRWELSQSLSHEPARYAASVPTEKVLFVSAAFDTVVPRRNQSLLWEGLGRPERLDMPFGHYTAAVALDRVIGAAAAHFHAHCP